ARNIFKVETEDKESPFIKQETEDNEFEKLEPTTLKLVLWGTVTGGSNVYAVIEDKKVRQQSLYEEGDSIQGAKIKKILRHEVILTYQGKDQVLEIETDNKNVRASVTPTEKINLSAAPGDIAFQKNPSYDMNDLIKQAKMRPHFTEGEADGLMVYGIRPNSVFRKIGLRNADIIKDINGTQIVSAEDASSIYDKLKEADNAKITLLRRGKIEELYYHVKNGRPLITTLPENNKKTKGDE
ncbi:MAG: PDZ domain-containing protein, partial [Desulfobacteraceae bacterium]|nr:PDZ domain-containing protein [Desulfobacteraceae bacterium]